MGDSITAGTVSGSEPGDPYAALLADALGPDFDVTQVGCGAASSLDWAPSATGQFCGSQGIQIPNFYEVRAVPELPADLVTILLGTNDAMGFFEPAPVDPEVYGDAIEELVFGLLADGANQVLLMTPPSNFSSIGAQLNLIDYREEIFAICGAIDGAVCGPDVFTLLGTGDFESGNVHPNAAGHQKLADALQIAVQAVVPEPATGALVALGLLSLAAGRGVRRRTG